MKTGDLKAALLSRRVKPLQWTDESPYRIYAAGVRSFFEIRDDLFKGEVTGYRLYINDDETEESFTTIDDAKSFCELSNISDYIESVDDFLNETIEE